MLYVKLYKKSVFLKKDCEFIKKTITLYNFAM